MDINFSGVWKGNLEKSKLFGPQPKALLVMINHAEPDLVVEMITTKMDDTEAKLLVKYVATGKEVAYSVQGIQVRSRSRWVGAEFLIESWANLGGHEAHFRDYWELSSDGRTLTMEHRDDDLAGQVTVLEKAD